jgi:hypothetical protein
LGRQSAQLVINQRQELVGGSGITLFDGGQNAGDFGHEAEDTLAGQSSQEGIKRKS